MGLHRWFSLTIIYFGSSKFIRGILSLECDCLCIIRIENTQKIFGFGFGILVVCLLGMEMMEFWIAEMKVLVKFWDTKWLSCFVF